MITYILLMGTICSIQTICPIHALSSTTTSTSSASTSAGQEKKIIPRDGLVKTLTDDGLMTLTKIGNDDNNNYREVSIFV